MKMKIYLQVDQIKQVVMHSLVGKDVGLGDTLNCEFTLEDMAFDDVPIKSTFTGTEKAKIIKVLTTPPVPPPAELKPKAQRSIRL
jgi:hypothetical protein